MQLLFNKINLFAIKLATITTILLVALDQLPYSTKFVAGQRDEELFHALNDSKFETLLNNIHNSNNNQDFEEHEHSRCEPLNIPFCEGVEYNQTILPNFLSHQTQQEVISEINIYHPLMRVNCSPDLKLFLCTVYAPICFDHINGSNPLKLFPCRSLCESARIGCSGPLKQFDSDWPAALQCHKFPEKTDKNVLCVGKEEDGISFGTNNNRNDGNQFGSNQPSLQILRDIGFVCPKNFELNSYTLNLNGKSYNNCAMPCEDVLLDNNQTQIVRLTTGILAIICIISTIFTCTTFLMDTKRFEYPARPIIIISFCQLIVAICYLIGFLTSNKIACNDPAEPPKSLPNMKMIRTTTMGNKKGSCTLQFMALYFFQISTIFWWLMLTISWYMIARLKWAPEAVSSVAKYFHLFSWTTAALLTIYLSVLGNIEGDSLTGTCYVSISNQESINLFLTYPIAICLGIGSLLFTIGCKSLWDSNETLRREYGKQTDEHYKLIMRIALFTLLFMIFSLIFLMCQFYEQKNLNTWMLAWLSKICNNRNYSIPCPVKDFKDQAPNYTTFVLKYVATMAVGIISALFMLSEKTLTSYKEAAELCNYKM